MFGFLQIKSFSSWTQKTQKWKSNQIKSNQEDSKIEDEEHKKDGFFNLGVFFPLLLIGAIQRSQKT